MDQVGALIGPLTVAGVLAVTGDDYAPALGVLAAPGVAALAVLVWLRTRVPDPVAFETPPAAAVPAGVPARSAATSESPRLPRAFWTYAVFTGVTMAGFATFGVLSFHFVQRHLVSTAVVPVLYAAAMAADAPAALADGWIYDRVGARAMVALPVLAAVVPALAFTDSVPLVVLGVLVWGAAVGIQESTLRAVVADLIPVGRRATAYGIFAGVLGAGSLAGGALTGALYDDSVPALVGAVAAIQAAALVLLLVTTSRSRTVRAEPTEPAEPPEPPEHRRPGTTAPSVSAAR
ncbi:MFS transporter [Actinacidiphila acidipaludis]|uniref:MFS transporter n=1 Tax=Actinacidiphila acidipaludis TaxID=2873382 RepID=A0ABS7Q9Z1_9ACTN|nr:MFS transporter [Streptomyces acidipaludis]MBY8879927.1 MFS transporter [Streptomyces acidipaludis]